MSNKKTLELSQLKALKLKQIENYKAEAEKRKAELETLKEKGGKEWTDELQDEFNELAIFLVDVDDIIEEKKVSSENTYKVPAKEGKLIHLKVVSGCRFNPHTGKEESKPAIKKFTYGEFQVFKKNYKLLGYSVIEVMHDPYNEANAYITKKD